MAMVRFTSSHSQTDKKNCHKVVQYNVFSFFVMGFESIEQWILGTVKFNIRSLWR